MLREVLDHIAKNYLGASQEKFSSHALAGFLRNDAPREASASIGNTYYQFKGSAGQSNWAQVPWICIFDPVVTTSALRGYYVGYLFAADMQTIILFLGQGTTSVREEFGKKTIDVLHRFAGVMRDRLPEAKARASAEKIRLNGNSTLANDYESGTVLHISYKTHNLPNEEVLVDDLRAMLRFYAMLVARGGRDAFEDSVEFEADVVNDKPIIERKKYRYHRKIERNSRAGKMAKKVHGYICQCCDFNFEAKYGELGKDYIEAHHLLPLSLLPEDVPVSQDPKKDFAVLCANCHRMIHRKGAPQTISQLKAVLQVKTS